ncbi:hypothetical protein BCON_0226g00170 [Botryotinia convoluta]|uniref:Uncharacterized protein n=1 Tax=Botryotinia convoluta TaxID=54673 RepID=A0A4Z1HIN2_9HELO|nr:hypothetical protein BCON_0226g00170 [Botryotinia convoluta]
MVYNSDRNRPIRHQPQHFAPQASQTTANSYYCPLYNQHATQYATPALKSDATFRWSDTNSTTSSSETTSLPRSEIERLIHEDTERDRRRCGKWEQWAREQEEEDRLAFAAENARKEEYRYRLEVLNRQTREYEKLKVETDRGWRVYSQKFEADEQSEADRQRKGADRRERLRTNSSRDFSLRREHTTSYVSGTSG